LFQEKSLTNTLPNRDHPLPGTPNKLTANLFVYLSLAAIAVLGSIFAFSYPIIGQADQDLWYHLNGGRFFIEHDTVLSSGFFSFLAESRTWTNYYWLSQVIFYQIFTFFDYHGLAVFRTIIYLVTIFLAGNYLLKRKNQTSHLIYYSAILLAISWAILPRYFHTVRPHIFSYLEIVLCIYLLEKRGRLLLFLPLLAMLWGNLHGVEYPVLYILCFSYLAEFLQERYIKKRLL
jgi:hypothetical protein